MRALTLIADRKLELADVPAPPPPGEDEVQVRVKAVALNHLDLWGFRGMAFTKRKLPLVVGAEASGAIASLGAGVTAVFGERAKSIPISSNKSMIGHTLSAAGAVEAVFTLLTIAHQRIPPTINYQIPDPAIPLDVVPNQARDAKLRHVISNSFGFGGQNVSLVMGLEPA